MMLDNLHTGTVPPMLTDTLYWAWAFAGSGEGGSLHRRVLDRYSTAIHITVRISCDKLF